MNDDTHNNPYRSFGTYDPHELETIDTGPPPAAPRVIGLLNILFGLSLGLCGLCQGFSLGTQAVAQPQMQARFNEALQKEADAAQDQIELLENQLAEEEDDQAIAELQQQIELLEGQVEVFRAMPNPLQIWGLEDKRVMTFLVVQCVAAVVLNLMLFSSGVGLLNFREWGRKLGVWTAALKIASLLVASSVMILIVAPMMADGMGDFMEKVAERQADNVPAPDEIRTGMIVVIAVWTGVFTLLGLIYPIICLWQLNRSQVKRACQAASRGQAMVQNPYAVPPESWT